MVISPGHQSILAFSWQMSNNNLSPIFCNVEMCVFFLVRQCQVLHYAVKCNSLQYSVNIK